MSLPEEQISYLDRGRQPVHVTLHPPASEAARDTAAILCPPFGWEEVCFYRSGRAWARRLAAAGYPCLRLSYPATGDSGGNARDPGQLDAWTDAITQAATWARRASGARRAVAIGIGLGGLLAYRAAAVGAAIDDLVLWATPARGHALIRQLRAFSALELAQFFEGLEPPEALPPGELQAGGFLLSADTVQALDELDLITLPLPRADSRRVLLLDRDGIAVDPELDRRLGSLGAAVTIAPGTGYAAMTSHPQQARAPLELIDRVTAWLGEASGPALATGVRHADAPGARPTAMLRIDGAPVEETPLAIEQSFGQLPGILAQPVGPHGPGLCIVFLNAGAVRRVGPNRMWVEAARRWAARGVPSFRFDVEGIGDADGDASPYAADAGLYVPELVTQVVAAIESLQARGVGQQFVLVGLCAGAYWAFQAALGDARVVAALMLNPRALVWDSALLPARDFRALRTQRPSWSKIRRLATVERVGALVRWMLAGPKRRFLRQARAPAEIGDLNELLERLQVSEKRALFLFSEHEPLRDELFSSGAIRRLEEWANVTLDYIPVRDHTLRPNQAQRQAHAGLDRALQLELDLALARPAEPALRA